ncbi:hypothetical protein [Pseudonocardia broussonetiae]|uniref:Uncharacterized protein n=1 Tax=Pseudonocardia broussonetiae TaxID=2736640 RepID=A0A6M6JHP3_9PSEU|nr:hypothetical protein [Pseudonocardia broussonetiae]QJY46417.1 hypothetical protein HOP40_11880 [Pseudonocardia broussonetiae]
MFFDSPHLTLTADLRHRELLAEAEGFRLGRLARAARRDARRRPAAPQPAPPEPPAPPDPSALGGTPGERRCLVPR